MRGKLNIFQKTMLQWNDLHPYNAVHVVRIPHALDWERLGNVINGTLETQGISNLTLDRERGTYHYHGGAVLCTIKTIAEGESSRLSLTAEIEQQLNTPFMPSEEFNPFRFFVAPETDSFSLGLVYFHAIADGESVVRLLKNIVATYTLRIEPRLLDPLELYPPRHDSLLRHHPGLLLRKLAALPTLIRNVRNSCRPRFRDAQNLRNGFARFSLNPGSLSALLDAAKAWGVTLNDLFLGLMMRSVSPMAPDRAGARRRRKISFGSIVNIRKDLGLDSQRSFGLFLGSFIVTHEVPNEISMMDLARDIRRQTLRIKQDGLYLGTPLELALGRFMLSLFSTEQRKRFYQKHYPLWGGITNMNLNSIWEQPPGERSIDYFRAVSTGPATPLVLAVTTVRDVVNIGFTYRSTVFSATEIEQVKSYFLGWEKHLKGHL
jgi:NRPS condensation-like uncharacterized protein